MEKTLIILLAILLWIFLISPWGHKFQFYANKWLWGSVSIIASLFFMYSSFQSIDFSKPIFSSIYWEAIGYFFLSIFLFGLGVSIILLKLEDD